MLRSTTSCPFNSRSRLATTRAKRTAPGGRFPRSPAQAPTSGPVTIERRPEAAPHGPAPAHTRPLRAPPQRARRGAGVALVPDPRPRRDEVRAAHLLPARPRGGALPRGGG